MVKVRLSTEQVFLMLIAFIFSYLMILLVRVKVFDYQFATLKKKRFTIYDVPAIENKREDVV